MVNLHCLFITTGFTEDEFILLDKSQKNSDSLVKLEKIAINAIKGNHSPSVVGTPNQKMAINLLHGNEYHNAKIGIMAPINQFYEKLDQRTKAQLNGIMKI